MCTRTCSLVTPGHTCRAWSPALVPLVGYGVLTVPQDMHPYGGSHTPGGREDRTAVLGAFLDSIPQPAEHMGPATGQRKCLHRDTYLQLTSILLPDNANIRGTWWDKDHLHLHPLPLWVYRRWGRAEATQSAAEGRHIAEGTGMAPSWPFLGTACRVPH